jgi:hypothetical protein
MPTFHTTLIPAYGRDYKSKAAVQADLDAHKDFLLSTSRKPINDDQMRGEGMTHCHVRYDHMRKVGLFEIA